jgi:hypothetical protein
MSDGGRFDEILDALSEPYRRQMLLALISTDRRTTVIQTHCICTRTVTMRSHN